MMLASLFAWFTGLLISTEWPGSFLPRVWW